MAIFHLALYDKTTYMKRLLPIIYISLLLASCARQEKLQTGDLIFVGLDLETMTAESDNLTYIHTAIAEVTPTDTFIIDATIKNNVTRYPIAEFLSDFTLDNGTYPKFVVMRMKDDSHVAEFVENAKRFVGLKYNSSFMPTDTAKYCTELIRDSYVVDGKPLFDESPIDFTDANGNIPHYWVWLFDLIKIDIPQGVMGTSPNSMIKSTLLTEKQIDITK